MDYTTLSLTIIIGGLILYLWRFTTHFKRLGVPHKTPFPFLGNCAQSFRNSVHFVELVSNYIAKWPDAKYVGFYLFNKPAIIVQDIELIKTITVKNFDNFHDHKVMVSDTDSLFSKSLFALKGDKWRETRAVLSPAFTANKMRQMFDLMVDCTRNFTEHISENIKRGEKDVEIKLECSKYTVDVIATCAFGISINSFKNPTNEFYVLGKNVMKMTIYQRCKFFILMLCPILVRILNIQILDQKLVKFFTNVVKTTVETRKEKGIVRPDMIQLMMESNQKANGLQMDIVDMTSQAFLFFLGGFETSSSLMSYAAIALAENQAIQDRLFEEIDGIMAATNGNPTYDAINSMPYLEAILYETLRYYPIAGFMDRVCVSEFQFPPPLPGWKPVTIKPGDVIWISSYRIHMDPEFYENPQVFDPNRFVDQKMNINTPTFLGFGIGPRSCIGNRFALLENKILLFWLLSKFKLEVSPKLIRPIKYATDSMVIMIKGGFWVRVLPRN